MMKNQAVISPENLGKQGIKRGLLGEVVRYYFVPLWLRLRAYCLRYQWRHHADPRRLDWDWGAIHYNRIALVNLLVRKFNDCRYLEIGCASNSLFNSVPVLNKIGVDPAAGGNRRETSDQFFESNSDQYDVIFIDGLHTYEQVRRDVINAIRCAKVGSWVGLHDMLPRTWLEHHVPIVTCGPWTGDVWKVAFELAETPGIDFRLLKIDHGVGVFRVNDTNAQLKDLTVELNHKGFTYFFDNLKVLPIVEWEESQAWLESN